MTTARGLAARSITAVIHTARAANRQMPLPIAFPASSGRFSPIFWPVRMVIPIANPVIMTVMDCMIWLPVETADTSAAVPNWPTTSRSTAPYIACKKSANSTGKAKRISGDKIFPSVKLWFPFMKSPRAIKLLHFFLETWKYTKKPDKIPGGTRHLIRLCNCDHKPSDEPFLPYHVPPKKSSPHGL